MATIESFIHRKVVVLHEDQSVLQAARAMYDNGIGCIVISDHHRHVVGIVTDRDLVCSALAFSLSSSTPLSEVMTPNPVTLEENSNLQNAVDLMTENGIRRIPIVHRLSGNKQKCVGLIALDDLIAFQNCDPATLSSVVKSQVLRLKKKSNGKHTVKHPDVSEGSNSFNRSEAHAEHTLNRFYKKIRVETGLDESLLEQFTTFVLSSLIQRLHYNSAAHFIAQLPKNLQEQLLDLPAGPDKKITLKKILKEISERLHFDEGQSKILLSKFFHAVGNLVDPREMEHIQSQLPDDLRSVLKSSASEVKKGA